MVPVGNSLPVVRRFGVCYTSPRNHMGHLKSRHLTGLILAIVTACVVAIVPGCRGQEMGTLDQIQIVKYRYVLDESDDVVRVIGLARNAGELPTPEAELVATLRSRTGSFKGQNRIALPGLEAGAEEEFAIAANSHGSVEAVEFQIVEPGTIIDEDGQQADDATEEEVEGDGS